MTDIWAGNNAGNNGSKVISSSSSFQKLWENFQFSSGLEDPFGALPSATPSPGIQVWTLTQFFSVSFFCENSLICLEGRSMTSHRGNTILFRSSQQLPRLRLGPSKGFLS